MQFLAYNSKTKAFRANLTWGNIVYDIFLYKFGITVLLVMMDLLDISISCLLGDLCEMSSIPELECT